MYTETFTFYFGHYCLDSLDINMYPPPFLGPRGPLVLPSVGPSVPSVPSVPQEKSGSLIYRHICLMNHEKTHQTNPMAPWDPLDALSTPLDPLGPPGPPNPPPQTHKQVSWPHCTLKITSTASQITFTFNPVTDVAPSTLSLPSPPSP